MNSSIALNGKRASRYVKAYLKSTAEKLGQVYTRWSSAKNIAYYDCISIMLAEGGCNPRIISHNSMTFTFGFEVVKENGTDLRIETAWNSYVIRDYLPF